jgi:TonB family protein
VYDLDQVQVRPAPLNSPELAAALRTAYPPHLEEAGIGGAVVVEMVVGPDGQPRDMRLVSSTDTAFDAPSIAMVSLLRFSPAQVDGRAVGVRLELPISWEPGTRLVDAPGPDSGDTYQLDEVDELPRIRNADVVSRALERAYPPHMRDAGLGATVHVRFVVGPDGTISRAYVTSSTNPQFDQATLLAIQDARFRPAKEGGAPVAVWVELPVQWRTTEYGGMGFPMTGNRDPLRLGCPIHALRC